MMERRDRPKPIRPGDVIDLPGGPWKVIAALGFGRLDLQRVGQAHFMLATVADVRRWAQSKADADVLRKKMEGQE